LKTNTPPPITQLIKRAVTKQIGIAIIDRAVETTMSIKRLRKSYTGLGEDEIFSKTNYILLTKGECD